jgi:hypothetical protein
MLQINPFLDCTVYSGIVVHIGRNIHLLIKIIVLFMFCFVKATAKALHPVEISG